MRMFDWDRTALETHVSQVQEMTGSKQIWSSVWDMTQLKRGDLSRDRSLDGCWHFSSWPSLHTFNSNMAHHSFLTSVSVDYEAGADVNTASGSVCSLKDALKQKHLVIKQTVARGQYSLKTLQLFMTSTLCLHWAGAAGAFKYGGKYLMGRIN